MFLHSCTRERGIGFTPFKGTWAAGSVPYLRGLKEVLVLLGGLGGEIEKAA